MKFGQILACYMTNISNMFLAHCWRLETSSRPFYDFIKMKIKRDLVICNSQHLLFLIVTFSKKIKLWNLGISWQSLHLLCNWNRLLLEKDLSTSPPNCVKHSWKLLSLFISINWQGLVTSLVVIQMIYWKMHPVSCANIHHDVTDLVNHRVIKIWKLEYLENWT